MAREWSLQETKALVDEHIALKEAEKLDICTASEHWNKVSNKLREKGFRRSSKSCNKRWYRLERYEVQIFSFNMMEEGKSFWDLSRAAKLEFCKKWPQLLLEDGIDKEIFDAMRKILHAHEKKETVVAIAVCAESKRGIQVTELSRELVDPVAALLLNSTALVKELKKRDNFPDFLKQPGSTTQPIPSQEAGFKLQERELKERRAAELTRNNRTGPDNNTFTLNPNQLPSPHQNPSTTFGSITVMLPSDESPAKVARASNAKPPILFKRVNTNRSCKLDTSPNNIKCTHLLAKQQPSGSDLISFQSTQNAKTNSQGAGHLPLPYDIHIIGQVSKDGASSDFHHPIPLDVPPKMHQLGEKCEVILGEEHGHLQTLERQLHNNIDVHHFSEIGSKNHDYEIGENSLGMAIGGLGAHLGAIAKVLRDENAREQEFGKKMLLFVDCMVVSLQTMAHVSTRF